MLCSSSMRRRFAFRSLGPLVFLFTALLARGGALEDYVGQPDTHYSSETADERKTNGFTIAHLQMVSQQWREHALTHHLQLVVPEKVRNPDIAFVFVTG